MAAYGWAAGIADFHHIRRQPLKVAIAQRLLQATKNWK
jgi:hypothetical protein